MKLSFIIALLMFSFGTEMIAQDGPVYELRTYYCLPGKRIDLINRFQNHTLAIFDRFGMENVGYWLPEDQENVLIYILKFDNKAAKEQAWKNFMADPEWQRVWKASEENGKIVEKVESVMMKETDYSPGNFKPKMMSGVYELRIYTPAEGDPTKINARFRDHTIKLFEKHGMENVVYFNTFDEKDGGSKLIYLLTHKSRQAGQESFGTFRVDPAWVKAKTDSEANGPIVTKVESIYMKSLPFSNMK